MFIIHTIKLQQEIVKTTFYSNKHQNPTANNCMSYVNRTTNKPPKYMLDPFDHQLPAPSHPQRAQNDFLSLWPSYTRVLYIA